MDFLPLEVKCLQQLICSMFRRNTAAKTQITKNIKRALVGNRNNDIRAIPGSSVMSLRLVLFDL